MKLIMVSNHVKGSLDIYLIGKGAFEMVVLEDNQATIRILESRRSPAFRHADKTQRLNLAWLAEQFQRKHFTLVYVASALQAADILTKPFTNAEKWNQLLKLLCIAPFGSSGPGPKSSASRPGGPVAPASSRAQDRVSLEVCCGKGSKLGDSTRFRSKGCSTFRLTEEIDLTNPETRKRFVRDVLQSLRSIGSEAKLLVWISLPCTGGSPGTHVNKEIPSAAAKIDEHQQLFKRLWGAMVDLINSLRAVKPFIAIEWPKNCTYWKLEKVNQFCKQHNLCPVSFDGCMLGVVDKHQVPIRKPWTVQTN